jgi:GH15 family glucan-1,4-alpha-glucosidase
MRATWTRVRTRLAAPNGLLYRYRTGDSPGEGAFGVCAFWAAEYLALGGGPLAEAERMFEHVLRFANDVGLYAEEMDPTTGAPLGNFPQAFTHIGLINAALSIEQRIQRGHAEPPVPEVSRPQPQAEAAL